MDDEKDELDVITEKRRQAVVLGQINTNNSRPDQLQEAVSQLQELAQDLTDDHGHIAHNAQKSLDQIQQKRRLFQRLKKK